MATPITELCPWCPTSRYRLQRDEDVEMGANVNPIGAHNRLLERTQMAKLQGEAAACNNGLDGNGPAAILNSAMASQFTSLTRCSVCGHRLQANVALPHHAGV